MKEFNLLSHEQKRVRSAYLSLRSGLEQQLFHEVLVGSYEAFQGANEPYPFHMKKEFKPAARIQGREHKKFKESFVIFSEGTIPPEYKNYLRTRRNTVYNGENLQGRVSDALLKDFESDDRMMTSPKFPRLIAESNGLESALLIQRDSSVKSRARFALTDAFVKVDYPITDAAEMLMRHLRYVNRQITELDAGEDSSKIPTSEKFEEMFYKYYGLHPATEGNRRIAAAVAAQLLRVKDPMSTVYVSSQEERTLTRICGSELDKFMLIHVPNEVVKNIEEANKEKEINLAEYAIDETKSGKVLIYQISYGLTGASSVPEEKKRRNLNSRNLLRKIKYGIILPRSQDGSLEPIVADSLTRGRNGLLK